MSMALRCWSKCRIICTSDAADLSLPKEEKTSDEILAEFYLERFGPDVKVEIDNDDMPVSVNGYPFRTVEAGFNVRGLEDKSIHINN